MNDPKTKYTNEYLAGMTYDGLLGMLQSARAAKLAIETQKAAAGGYFERTHLFGKVRRDIARIETELRKAART